jgi:predicted alpha-1,6-mannanase (GH76 family)
MGRSGDGRSARARGTYLAVGAALIVSGVSSVDGARATPAVDRGPSCSAHALADYRAMKTYLVRGEGTAGTRYFEHSGSTMNATSWSHSQAAAAALDVALACGNWTDAKRSLAGFERYRHGRSYDPRIGEGRQDRFYDDAAWIALNFVQAFEISGRARYLTQAERVFSWLETGFSPHGGLYWRENHIYRNAATNGPALQLALHLFEETREQRYLHRARQIDDFLNQQLRSPEGLIYDGVADDGGFSPTIWSYNQGSYIGAGVQLYRATGDPEYLRRAVETASAALARFGEGDRLWRQPPAFNAIFFRNLLDLDVIAPDPRYRAALEAYLARARDSARTRFGLYQAGGLGSYGPGTDVQVVDQAAFVQMHALLGMSALQLDAVS